MGAVFCKRLLSAQMSRVIIENFALFMRVFAPKRPLKARYRRSPSNKFRLVCTYECRAITSLEILHGEKQRPRNNTKPQMPNLRRQSQRNPPLRKRAVVILLRSKRRELPRKLLVDKHTSHKRNRQHKQNNIAAS